MKIKVTKYLIIFISILVTIYFLFPVIPNTLDSREYKDTKALIGQVKKIKLDLVTLNEGWCHYDNCFMFYADKPVIANSKTEIVDKINSDKPFSFVMSKENFADIAKSIRQNKINIIKSNEKSVLFSNFKNI
ncbi:MAG: hypothetical protein LHV68_11590 [Elusimicrobia bacterium]|nr:hypothetical protein [Candidatus Liberimonas magnetica]